jgi:nicotinamide mononucleotide transporter
LSLLQQIAGVFGALGMSPLEFSANVFNLLSVWFSARNSVHTWWSGIVGCTLYGLLFIDVKLYADVTLQAFFVVSCVVGWWNWLRGGRGTQAEAVPVESGASPPLSTTDVPAELPITRVALRTALGFGAIALVATLGYGYLLHSLTDAANPFVDSAVLALSVLAQLLMVARKIETWPVWLVVDCIAVPLYASKGLWLTAGVYFFFLVLVVMGWVRWRRLIGERPMLAAA